MYEDLNLGICLKDEVLQVNTLDEFKRQRILLVGIDTMLEAERNKKHWIWSYTYYPVKWKYDCCSSTLIGDHYISIEEQYLLRLGTSNRELNLERRFRFSFFKLRSMGKTLRGEKIFQNKQNFILIFVCTPYFI